MPTFLIEQNFDFDVICEKCHSVLYGNTFEGRNPRVEVEPCQRCIDTVIYKHEAEQDYYETNILPDIENGIK
jgi:hypothetical protein